MADAAPETASQAQLEMDGKTYSVISCNYSFGQGLNDQGQPSTDVKGGPISLQVVASDDSAFIEWMIQPDMKKNGNINFMKSNGGGNLKVVKFENAICVGYSESFNSSTTKPMTISLNITAQKVTVGDTSHEKKWGKK